jgi:hypothetical protein
LRHRLGQQRPRCPTHELGRVLFEFGHADQGRVRALTGAYREAGGPEQVSRPGHFSMLIAQLGHITELAARRPTVVVAGTCAAPMSVESSQEDDPI